MNNCIFCKIINKEIPALIIRETEDYITFLDAQPVNFGHALVVPKKHFLNIYEISPEVLEKLGEELKIISTGIKKAVSADGINIDMNNDPAAGQIVLHAHFHIIPRFDGDGFTHWHSKSYEYPEQINELAQKIIKSISS